MSDLAPEQTDGDYERLRRAVRNIEQTEDGKYLFKYLMDEYIYAPRRRYQDAALIEQGQREVVLELYYMLNEKENFNG